MRETLTSPDIHSWIIANSRFIVGSFVKKIVFEDSMVIRLHSKDYGNRDLYLTPPGFIYFGEKRDLEVKGQSKFLNDILENSKVESITQPNFDRIVRIDFFSGKSIVFEMFGRGNIILLENNRILFAREYREWRGRAIKRGEEYKYPPSPVNPLSMDFEKFLGELRGDYEIVGVIATRFNLSHYSEIVCSLAGVEKDKKVMDLSEDEKIRIFETIKSFLSGLDGRGYLCNGKIMCIKSGECQNFDNINDAILAYLKGIRVESEEERIEKEQKKKLEEYKKLSDIYRSMGNEIISNIQWYNEIYEKLRRKEKIDSLISIDGKIARVKRDENAPEIELDITKRPSEIAQGYFSESKKLDEKIKGIMEVIGKIKKKEIKKEKKKERRRFWFERFRWFISSENSLVLAGRDAKTNEEVVKKYLGERDYYVHADIHGAPSVVVKNDGITEKTLVEAGIFGLCYSKAWNAGYMAGDAYWVTFSQVSKMAESGEYVPRGAWVIRGKRNYMRNLKLELGIGKIRYENEEILMAGPVDSLKQKTNYYIVIAPGDTSKENIAKIISEKFSWDIDDVMSILPPGPGRIVEEKHEAFEHSNNGEE
jgi:predicted ribosome quality control (RQC) complex YloA/Tae2 family protein